MVRGFTLGCSIQPPSPLSRASECASPTSCPSVCGRTRGRASDDAIRSLVISYKLIGTREWFVIHHTNCGMELFTNEIMTDLLAHSLETASFVDGKWKDTG